MSDAAFGVFSRIRYSGNPGWALFVAVRAGDIPLEDLPPIIADLWTRNDSPTADLGGEDWVEVFRIAGFFSYHDSRKIGACARGRRTQTLSG